MLEKTCLHCKEKLNNQGYVPFLLNYSFKCNYCQSNLYFSYSLWSQRFAAVGLVISFIIFSTLLMSHSLIALAWIIILFSLSLIFYSRTKLVIGTKEQNAILPKIHFVEIIIFTLILILILIKCWSGLLDLIAGPTILIA